MKNDLSQILKSFNIDINNSHLNGFNIFSKLAENTCCFIFDVKADKCCYLCPSIKEHTGYTHQKIIDGGFLFLKTISDTFDFPRLLIEAITLIKITQNKVGKSFGVNNTSLPFQIRHRDGHFLKLIIHLICIQKISADITILLGFIEKDVFFQGENAVTGFNITPREKEVLKLLAGGNSAKNIASELFISENTVITHRRHLKQKLKVKNSAELIKKSFELNILN